LENIESEIKRVIEKREVEAKAKEERPRKEQKTLITESITPKSDTAAIIFVIAFYVPMILFSQPFDETVYLDPMLKMVVSLVVIGGAAAYWMYTIYRGYNERISNYFIRLFITSKKDALRRMKLVRVLKTCLDLGGTKEEYNVEEALKKIKENKIKDLPLYAALFLGEKPEDDFILVTRGLKPMDALQWDVAEIEGRWDEGVSVVSECNIVTELTEPVPRATFGDTVPVYFLISNPRYASLIGEPANILEGVSVEEIIKMSSKFGKYEGLKWKAKYEDAETRYRQLNLVAEQSYNDALELAAFTNLIRKGAIAKAVSAKVSEEPIKLKGASLKDKLFDTKAKKAFWILLAGLMLAFILALVVPGILNFLGVM